MGTLKKQQKSRGTILICNAILAFSLEFTFSDNFVRIFNLHFDYTKNFDNKIKARLLLEQWDQKLAYSYCKNRPFFWTSRRLYSHTTCWSADRLNLPDHVLISWSTEPLRPRADQLIDWTSSRLYSQITCWSAVFS